MTRLVIHADDVGMCHGANQAFVELSHAGTITAGSVMVPCPWFPEIAEQAVADERLDLGVHLTLNAEKAHYRWAPVSGAGRSSGLVDNDGYLWPRVADTRRHADPGAVEEEWRAQIDRAVGAGIDVTHLDAHMGAALAPEWCERYVQVGVDYDIPVLIAACLADYGPNDHLVGTTDEQYADFVEQARTAGMPIFDAVLETDFDRAAGEAPQYQRMLTGLETDLVYCAYHPNAPGPGEVEVIEPATFHVRTDEYELFATSAWKEWLDAQPFVLTGMKQLRDDFRAARS